MADKTGKSSKVPVHPIVSKLVARGEGAAVIRGYVGPAEEGICRIYRSLDLTSYVEFPEDAAIEAVEDPNSNDGRMRIIIGSLTQLEITDVHKRKVTAGDLRVAPWPPGAIPDLIAGRPYEWPYGIEEEQQGERVDGPDVQQLCEEGCRHQYHRCVHLQLLLYGAGILSWGQFLEGTARCAETERLCQFRCRMATGESIIPDVGGPGRAPREPLNR